jgi:tRNA wybutosine-synthesizing protein 1
MMENVPWQSNVKEFSEELASKSGDVYEVACVHAHSCCLLLAKVDKFKINSKRHIWIDYDRFHEPVSFPESLLCGTTKQIILYMN